MADTKIERPFQIGDEIRWEWTGQNADGKWFQAQLTEQHPKGYPSGWAGVLTDPGTVYAPDDWDRPAGYRVYLDEPSMTLVRAAEEVAGRA